MDHVDETIYNLLNHIPQSLPTSSPNLKTHYQSIFASNVRQNFNRNKHSHRTMGLALVPKPDPSRPLRRREKYVELPQITPFVRSHQMPPIPKVNNHDEIKLNSTKNFIQENITKIINSLPKCPHRYIVSDRKGNKFLIDGSGLQKDFIYKKNYGRVPQYLRMRKALNQSLVDEKPDDQSKTMLLSPEERLCWIDNLKQRHKETFAKYQRLPLRIETRANKIEEASLINELKCIEQDLEFLEKYEQIFVVK